LAELWHGTIYFMGFYETKFGIFGEFLATLGVKGLKVHPLAHYTCQGERLIVQKNHFVFIQFLKHII